MKTTNDESCKAAIAALLRNSYYHCRLDELLPTHGPPAQERLQAIGHSWDDLPRDEHMADGGTYRSRRYSRASFFPSSKELTFEPHAPFFQSKELNHLNGGTRHFAPLTPHVATHPTLKTLVTTFARIFTPFVAASSWDLNIHQVRIDAEGGEPGMPTPEGIHRDGVTFTSLLLVERRNVAGGDNYIYDDDKREIDKVLLREPGDLILLDDRKLFHAVAPIYQLDPHIPAHRKMCFIEFTAR